MAMKELVDAGGVGLTVHLPSHGDWPFLRIAHRGAAGLAPENTLRAIELALRYGVEMVEIDVRPCADGTLMVVHDDDTRRISGARGSVGTSTVEQLKSLDLGGGERMPTLPEALDLLRGRALVNLDQKRDNLAAELLRCIDRSGSRDETMLSGHALTTFRAFHVLAPEIPYALSISAPLSTLPLRTLARISPAAAHGLAGRLIRAARQVETQVLTLEWTLARRAVVDRCKRAGLHVLTWTVDDPGAIRALRMAGVDGITSNRPDLLQGLS